MKKSILILTACFLFISTASFAQFFVGPKVGAGISSYRLSSLVGDAFDSKPRFSYAFGVAFEVPVAAGFSVQAESYLVRKGSKLESEILNPFASIDAIDENGNQETVLIYADFTENINYLEIPLFAKYEFPGETIGFHAMIGPVLSIGLGGKINLSLKDEDGRSRLNPNEDSYNTIFKDQGGDLEQDVEFGSSTSDTYNSPDFGFGAGAGVYIEAGPGRINADLRLVLGISNMIETEDPDISQFNNLVQFSIGYMIPIGGY